MMLRTSALVANLRAALGRGTHLRRRPEPPPTPGPTPAPAAEEERSTGLPKKGTWTFNLDVGLGGFGFANSLYTNVRPDPSGDLSDNWAESFAKPAVSASFGIGRERALRQDQRGGRAHVRGAAEPGG